MSRNGAGPAAQTAIQTPQAPRAGRLRRAAVTVSLLVLGAVASLGIGFAVMQFPAVQQVFAQGTQARPSAADLPDTPFAAHAKEAGLTTCGTVFPVLGQLLVNGAQYDVQSAWHKEEPNKHAVQALVGLNYASQDYSGPAAGIVFASPVGSACEGAMVRVTPFARKCQDVVQLLPQGSALASALGQVPVYNVANNGGQVLLVSSGDSCVAVSVTQATG